MFRDPDCNQLSKVPQHPGVGTGEVEKGVKKRHTSLHGGCPWPPRITIVSTGVGTSTMTDEVAPETSFGRWMLRKLLGLPSLYKSIDGSFYSLVTLSGSGTSSFFPVEEILTSGRPR